MYRRENPNQLSIEEFFLPFGGKLQSDNRWVKMAELMPWDLIESIYLKSINEDKGNPRQRISFRLDCLHPSTMQYQS